MFDQTVARSLFPLGLRQRGPDPYPRQPAPMLLGRADKMFASSDWVYEPKWDGFRVLASVRDGVIRLISRNGHPFTNLFGPVTDARRGFPTTILLDGEVICIVSDAPEVASGVWITRKGAWFVATARHVAVTLPSDHMYVIPRTEASLASARRQRFLDVYDEVSRHRHASASKSQIESCLTPTRTLRCSGFPTSLRTCRGSSSFLWTKQYLLASPLVHP